MIFIDNLSKSYNGNYLFSDVTIGIKRGMRIGLVGANGAGKTTLFNLITGFDRPDSGKWTFHQLSKSDSWTTDLSGLRPHQIAHKGMVRTFQLTKSLAKMTVLDNMNKRVNLFVMLLFLLAGNLRKKRFL